MKFEINEAPIDRAIRIVLGVALAAVALVTGIVGICPLYAILGVGTKSRARSPTGSERGWHTRP